MSGPLANDTDDECPGFGKCHGCMQWCYQCGDVDTVCDAARCDCHRCYDCKAKLSAEDHEAEYGEMWKWCEACRAKHHCATERSVQEEIDGGVTYPSRGRW